MSVEIISDKETWDNFVLTNPHSIVFQKWEILKIIEKYSGYSLLTYAVYDEKKSIIGICPLFLKRIGGLKYLFSQPPEAGIPYIGILLNPAYYTSTQHKKEHIFKIFVDELNRKISEMSPNFISLSLLPDISDIREFLWNGFQVKVNYSFVVDIDRDLDAIWNSFNKNCRRDIRSSDIQRLQIEQTVDTEKFFSVMTRRYNEQHLPFPFISPEYMRQLLMEEPDNIKCYFLKYNDEIVNLKLIYTSQQRVVLWKGGVNLNRDLHSNEIFIWEIIKRARDEGFKELELQGANIGRLSRFKSKFNPQLEQYYTIEKMDILGKVSRALYLNFIRKK